jgi:catechol 2,3-dioxygenase-like lactoylglutathione lyase family enzyme
MLQLHEIAYFTDDVPRMQAFYERLLGAAPIAASEGMAIFLSGDTKLLIHRNYQAEEGELPPENHVAFRVGNVDAAGAQLQQAGLAVERPPQDYYWGRSAYLRDPDGHLIELIAVADRQ